MRIDPKQVTMCDGAKSSILPPIPLARPEENKVKVTETLKFKLYSNPADKDGPTYDMNVRYLVQGPQKSSSRLLLLWNMCLKVKVLSQHQINTAWFAEF
jgi:hypothetical protein